MELKQLKAAARNSAGKCAARRVRVAGNVPAVLYGEGQEPVSIEIAARALSAALHGKQGEHAILQLDIDGRPELSGPAMVKAVQHHHIRGTAIHADLMRINLSKRIHTLVPIVLAGRCVGVINGGVVDHQLRDLEVECLATEVPDAITVDITNLDIGHSIHVSDIAVPANVTVLTGAERAVVALHAPRVSKAELGEAVPEAAAAVPVVAAPAKS